MHKKDGNKPKLYTHFIIDSCQHPGCNNECNKKCWLNGHEIEKYYTHVEYLHTPTICKARRQADLYKTERLLYDS
jgi:hypothetical protein